MHIRPALATDQATIQRIVRAAHINPMGLDWRRFFVAEKDGQVIGTGQIKTHGDGSRELASVAVIPQYRQRGIASAIIRELLARESGKVYLFCRPPLESFYQPFGFRRIGRAEMPPYFRRMYGVASAFWTLARSPVQVIVMKRQE
jgi:N-acetylglutamate synthase-like GNAT family acetyltransferase